MWNNVGFKSVTNTKKYGVSQHLGYYCAAVICWGELLLLFFGLEAGESCEFNRQTYVAASSFSATLTKYASVRRTISDSYL